VGISGRGEQNFEKWAWGEASWGGLDREGSLICSLLTVYEGDCSCADSSVISKENNATGLGAIVKRGRGGVTTQKGKGGGACCGGMEGAIIGVEIN